MEEKITILYIDDEPINLILFKNLFMKKYSVITTESGMEGLKVLADNTNIKVVISDMKMPVMNGLEFISRAKSVYSDLYYYLLSGYELTHEIQESLANGLINNYFKKPFKVDEIDRSIQENFKII